MSEQSPPAPSTVPGTTSGVVSGMALGAVPGAGPGAGVATAEVAARLLDVIAGPDVGDELGEIEQRLSRLRADAEEAAEARQVLRDVPAEVLREAMRLRSAGQARPRGSAAPGRML